MRTVQMITPTPIRSVHISNPTRSMSFSKVMDRIHTMYEVHYANDRGNNSQNVEIHSLERKIDMYWHLVDQPTPSSTLVTLSNRIRLLHHMYTTICDRQHQSHYWLGECARVRMVLGEHIALFEVKHKNQRIRCNNK